VNYALLLAIVMAVSGCALAPPKVNRCSIINKDIAQCNPSDGSEPFDKPVSRMRGYQCLSPDDLAKTKAYLHKIIEELGSK